MAQAFGIQSVFMFLPVVRDVAYDVGWGVVCAGWGCRLQPVVPGGFYDGLDRIVKP